MGVYSGALIEVLRDLYDTAPLADELARISHHVRSVPEGRGFSPAVTRPFPLFFGPVPRAVRHPTDCARHGTDKPREARLRRG